MKKLIAIIGLVVVVTFSFAQDNTKNYGKIPSVDVKTLEGNSFNMSDISNDGKPIILTFWQPGANPVLRNTMPLMMFMKIG